MRHDGQQLSLADGVDLVEHQQDRASQSLHERERKRILRGAQRTAVSRWPVSLWPGPVGCGPFRCGPREAMRRVHQKEHHIAALESVVDLPQHAAVVLGRSLVDARRVDQNDLRGG